MVTIRTLLVAVGQVRPAPPTTNWINADGVTLGRDQPPFPAEISATIRCLGQPAFADDQRGVPSSSFRAAPGDRAQNSSTVAVFVWKHP
ncbi:hypothetical protein [Shinella zoogloeoides]|uniref:hypothetical protein n=1 Tax=Shinella zoogloeoides TaxID=352475 RepID=UPI00299CE4D0|nr:hypothetical protein [Shinella zoogloeoides]